jgi:hypothetical protein
VNIALGIDHPACIRAAGCVSFSVPLHSQLSTGRYDWPASILPLDGVSVYLATHRTARKRARHARTLGYTFQPIRREQHEDEIHAINVSMPERQGRPMSAGYLKRPSFDPLPDYPCRRHRIDTYGVVAPDGALVAYIVIYVCGELAMVSQILGHADHLKADIMFLLAVGAFRATLGRSGPVTAFYNRHDSGGPGLRFHKERLGFAPERVAWSL